MNRRLNDCISVWEFKMIDLTHQFIDSNAGGDSKGWRSLYFLGQSAPVLCGKTHAPHSQSM